MRPEDHEQLMLMQWATLAQHQYPSLRLLFHIANERRCSPQEGQRLKALGVQPGVPDLCLPVPSGIYHGLYIELKAPTQSARVSNAQKDWISNLSNQGYRATVCYGWRDAQDTILQYLGGTTNAI